MKLLSIFLLSFLLVSCGKTYETAEAKILETTTEKRDSEKYFISTFEYQVEGETYQDTLELNVWKSIEDTLMTPMQGVKFDIQYNVDDPTDIIVEYQVKQ